MHGKIEGKKHEQGIKQMIILDSSFHFSLNHGWYKSGEIGVLCFGSQNFRLLTVQRQHLPMRSHENNLINSNNPAKSNSDI